MKSHLAILLLLPPILLCTGCEPSDDDVRGELDVTPAATILTGDERTVILTAHVVSEGTTPEPIIYPLEWSVTVPADGHVAAQSAAKAVYTHTGRRSGSNVILVRDQLGREGLASVSWEPENILDDDSNSTIF
jgi:hypothetical protein